MRTQREKVMLAAGGSVLLHLALLFAWALLAALVPGAQVGAVPPPEPEPLKVEVVEEATPDAPTPTPTPFMRPFVDTADVAEATPPPGAARLESGKNSAAASEEPSTGGLPLPSQRGKPMPAFAFSTQAFTPGAEPAAAATPLPATAPPPPAAATPRPPPDAALLTPAALPTDDSNPYDPAFRPPSNLTGPPLPTPARAAGTRPPAAGFRTQQEAAELSGGASRLGPASVDSEATPLGRYRASVINALTLRWNDTAQHGAVAAVGVVKIRLTVDRAGRVLVPRVLSNTGDEALASASLAAIQSARIPPMPADAAALLTGGQLPLDVELNLE